MIVFDGGIDVATDYVFMAIIYQRKDCHQV